MAGETFQALPHRATRRISGTEDRQWLAWAITMIEADFARSADTHLVKVGVPEWSGVDIYFKDESTHPSGSLKHRLARSLFLYGLCNGLIGRETSIIEASSGSTAISEAYFSKLLGLPFVAVVPRGTARAKLTEIERLGGRCELVDSADLYSAAAALAVRLDGHYMDQFTYAERATDWRGNNNIAETIFDQLRYEPHPVPEWVVVGVGTGGTSATIGRYIRRRRDACVLTKLAIVDPEGSVFAEAWRTGSNAIVSRQRSRIEGIGRPRVEPSFVPTVVDEAFDIPDADSVTAARTLSRLIGKRVGPSTGTNFCGVQRLARRMHQSGHAGSIVSIICDSGERYLDTIFNEEWCLQNPMEGGGLELA